MNPETKKLETCGGQPVKREHIVLERSARLNRKAKCFEGEDDVCRRKKMNSLKNKKKNGEESG